VWVDLKTGKLNGVAEGLIDRALLWRGSGGNPIKEVKNKNKNKVKKKKSKKKVGKKQQKNPIKLFNDVIKVQQFISRPASLFKCLSSEFAA
jgi:hypothetical protein